MMAKLPVVKGRIPTLKQVIRCKPAKKILVAHDWWSNGVIAVHQKCTEPDMRQFGLPVEEADMLHREFMQRYNKRATIKLRVGALRKIDGYQCVQLAPVSGGDDKSDRMYIQAIYYRYLRKLYPDAVLYGSYPHSPVVWRMGRRWVATVMVVHRAVKAVVQMGRAK